MVKTKKKNPTIRDIAKLANVSHTTVSLVLSSDDSKSSRVRSEIREKILKIAEDLNYRPNQVARSLATNKTKTIGLVLTTLRNPFYAELAQDIINRAMESDYEVFMTSIQSGIDEERKAVQNLIDRGVDGLIISSALRNDPVVDQLIKADVPVVLAMRNVERRPGDSSIHYVGVDNKRGGYLAVDHLAALGHKKIGLIAGPEETSTGHDRKSGALAALQDHGIDLHPELIVSGDFSRNSGYEAMHRLMKLKSPLTAIFAMNDLMALGVVDAIDELGMKVQEDIAVVGFDDIMVASLTGVDLTTVSQKKEIIGKIAVDYLLEIINGGSDCIIQKTVLDPILIVRKSCGFHVQRKS